MVMNQQDGNNDIFANMQKQLAQQANWNQELLAKINEQRLQIEEMRSSNKELRVNNEELRVKYEELRVNNEELRVHYNEVIEQNKGLISQNTDIKRQMEEVLYQNQKNQKILIDYQLKSDFITNLTSAVGQYLAVQNMNVL